MDCQLSVPPIYYVNCPQKRVKSIIFINFGYILLVLSPNNTLLMLNEEKCEKITLRYVNSNGKCNIKKVKRNIAILNKIAYARMIYLEKNYVDSILPILPK